MTQAVIIKNKHSVDKVNVISRSRVHQGSVFGPIPYPIVFNNITENIQPTIRIPLVIDHLRPMRTSTNEEILQHLTILTKWELR